MSCTTRLIATLAAATLSMVCAGYSADKPAPVDFTTQIKPLLATHCHECHGGQEQRSGLRLDRAKLLVRGGDRGAAVIPGNGKESRLYLALVGKGELPRMPMGKPALKDDQIALVKRWIDEGANVPDEDGAAPETVKSDHWAFQPIARTEPPRVKNRAWVRNPIDKFILARLEQEGLAPSEEANPETLARRLSLDLRGLPPTPLELQRFLNDDRPGAYERLVDRMLASPRYGERWGRHWLDVARYADSHGYTIDGPRKIWKYRDWVIDAINANMPFDQFITEQLAGDLLPDPTTEQLVATGFHRNTLINQEGGTDDEQFRVEAIVDRVETTGAAFLGLTVGCGRCHEHKYDPLSQREFYELFAIFNNCDEPTVQVPSPEQEAALRRLRAEIAEAQKPLEKHDRRYLKGLPEWEKQVAAQSGGAWTVLDPIRYRSEQGAMLSELDDKSIIVGISIPPRDTYTVTYDLPLKKMTAIRLEALTHNSLPKKGPGRASNGNFVLSELEVSLASRRRQSAGSAPEANASGSPEEAGASGSAKSAAPRQLELAKAVADHSQNGYPVSRAIDGDRSTGWAINVKSGSPNVDREAIFLLKEARSAGKDMQLTVTLRHNHSAPDYLLGRFRISVSDAPPELLAVPESIRKIVAIPDDKRTQKQKDALAAAFLETSRARKPLIDRLNDLRQQEERLKRSIPTTMVLRERKTPRQTHIHIRGDFLRKGAPVQPDVPDVLPPLSPTRQQGSGDYATRLDFARWLTRPDHPLTARVTVNRYWQRFFGIGIVRTENDFGTQGERPVHPELLDWLAGEFIRSGWNVKQMHRLIVTSAVYRQSSGMRSELLRRDPDNRLLARQSRLRLQAEVIRDASLAAAGLLSQKMKGPGVYPPQPEGIYVLTQQKKSWPTDTGQDRYRRGMYTYFWRSSPDPFLMTFDAPKANTTCTRRVRSNTPLQALTLANDRAFVEIAQGLAGRILREAPDDDEGRLRHAVRLCLGRQPDERELSVLSEFLNRQRERFSKDEQAAKAAAPAEHPETVSQSEAATWTSVARVLLNLDEFVTRE